MRSFVRIKRLSIRSSSHTAVWQSIARYDVHPAAAEHAEDASRGGLRNDDKGKGPPKPATLIHSLSRIRELERHAATSKTSESDQARA